MIKGAPKGAGTRPILARIKKSLFDILQLRIVGCSFLDLYAGTGSVGIEAISRGADWVTFVENDRRCVKVIAEGMQNLKEVRFDIIQADVLKDFHSRGKAYDIIFMGPPYKTIEKQMLALTAPTLRIIRKEKLLAPSGLIVAQHHVKEQIEDVEGLECARRKTYGDSHISFFRSI